MKTSSLIFFIFLLGIQGLLAQDFKQDIPTNIITSLDNCKDTNFSTNSIFNILRFESNQNIDMIMLFDKQGDIVLQKIPENNQIALSSLKSGFYLLCVYCKGIKVRKGILRKV
jgi:hypothetical protein